MKTMFLCAIVLVLVGIAAICVYARAENQQNSEADVRGLSDEELRAFLNTDPKAMAQIWSDDFVVNNPLNQCPNS